jgi:hypothetical protein
LRSRTCDRADSRDSVDGGLLAASEPLGNLVHGAARSE